MISIILFVFFNTFCSAQNKTEIKKPYVYYFYFNPIQLLNGTFQVSVEHNIIKKKTSICLVEGFIYSTNRINKIGFNAEIQYKINLANTGDAAKRITIFYFGPYLQYKYIELFYKTNYISYGNRSINNTTYNYVTAYGGGLIAGIKILYLEKISFDMYFGGGVKETIITGDYNKNYSYRLGNYMDYSGVIPKVGFQIGCAF